MSSHSLNIVHLIGNLTRDPELRYTQSGAPVCSIGLATNRNWVTESGEKKEETEFHKITTWQKLAELCSQILHTGDKAYFEGRLRTSKFQDKDGVERTITEIVANEMIALTGKQQPREEVNTHA
jgi:single-strand DNA-binding protein